MSVFLWLHDLPVSTVVRESSPVYATVETFHAIGMGVLVGTITVVNLRLLGTLKRIPVFMLVNLLPLIWGGFVINAISGSLMFMSDAVKMSVNRIFLTKMALIFTGFIVALALRRVVFKNMAQWMRGGAIPLNAKMLSCASLLVWYGAIVAGRLTAYFQ
ncbi:MAG TPA: DUF6644 family protein [Steroidobacteraceae bacterium]